MSGKGKIAVFVSGGPGPGINSVISSIAHFSYLNNFEVISLKKSFKSFEGSWEDDLVILAPDVTIPFRSLGGSFIQCSRFNPLNDFYSRKNFENFLDRNRVDKIAIIGGDGSTYLATKITENYPSISVVVCPKTIDNDLQLPDNSPTLGFSTARNIGADLVKTMLMDAFSSERWFIVTCMGRNTGLLASGVALASCATTVLVPEELENGCSIEDLINPIKAVFDYRLSRNKNYGAIIVAEGVISRLNSDFLAQVPKDNLGRIQYREYLIGELIKQELRKAYPKSVVIHQDLGFELRGSEPLAYDVEYGTVLGFGAVKFLDQRRSGLVVRLWQDLSLIEFESLKTADGKIKTRCVEVHSEVFQVAKKIGLDA